MKKRVVFSIIFLEIAIIVFFLIYSLKKILVATTSANIVFREGYAFQKDNKTLTYFYEPKANTEVIVNLRQFGKRYQYSIKEKFNSDTLHQVHNTPVVKDTSIFRIITIGDSFTFGSNLNTEETYPTQLEKILKNDTTCKSEKKFEVLNLGVSGYDIQYSVERFRERGVKYDADLVLWFIIEDDLKRVNELMMAKILQYREQMKENGEGEQLAKKGIYNADYKKARSEVFNQIGEEKILEMQKKYLKEFNQIYDKDLLIFTFPNMDKNYQDILTEFSKSRPKIFFYPGLVDIYKYNEILPDNHPNKKGAELIAEDIDKYLREHGLIPCN